MSDDPEEVSPPQPGERSGATDTADPVAIKRARRRIKSAEEDAVGFWREVFATPIGRREMWGILASGGAFEERFAHGPNGFPAPEATWCHAGEQRLAFRLYMSWMRLCPDGTALMLREHHPAFATPPPRPDRRPE
ncbi:MAG: hypothetical protein ACM3II_00095 [Rhodospirillaceae bacterium]